MGFVTQLKHAWNAFTSPPPQIPSGSVMSYNPNRRLHSFVTNDRSIVNAVLTRTAVDVAMIDFMHADVDVNGRFLGERYDSGLNYCLTREANIDQSAFAFKQDIVTTIFEDGVAAIVPVDTTHNPNTVSYTHLTLPTNREV